MYNYVDAKGNTIKAGDRVRIVMPPMKVDFATEGKVISISDPDGDTNDYGRVVAIPPQIEILFDDGDTDTYVMSWASTGWWDENAPFVTEEVEVIDNGS